MKKFNIVTARTYKDRDGNDKKAWRTVGQLIQWPAKDDKPESFSMELHMWPETKYSIFEERDRDQQPKQVDAGEDF
jgi:hypothetical protein